MATITTTEANQTGVDTTSVSQSAQSGEEPVINQQVLSASGVIESDHHREAVATPPASFSQRIWDTSLGQWVFYTGTVRDDPATSETTPNHTNNLDAATHEVLGSA